MRHLLPALILIASLLPQLVTGQSLSTRQSPWRLMFVLTSFSLSEQLGADVNPVAIELYQILTEGEVRPLVQSLTMSEGEMSITMVYCFSDKIRPTYSASRILDYSVSIPNGKFRAVLIPDPFFWKPAFEGTSSPDNMISDDTLFEITGLFTIVGSESDVSFPPIPVPEKLIRFSGVKAPERDLALGFSAYVDFEIIDGRIAKKDLTFMVDSDADGRSEIEIPGGPYRPLPKQDD